MKIRYTDSIVLFLDVLGFSDLVYNKNNTKIENYFSYIQADFHKHLSSKKFNYVIISDSIVVSAKKNKENLYDLVFVMTKIQHQLFLKGILVRGAISSGKLYVNKVNNIIVGPGLINAYNLEKRSKYPRIIIDRKIISDLFPNSVSFLNYLNLNSSEQFDGRQNVVKFKSSVADGLPYINFMLRVVRHGQTYNARNFQNVFDFLVANYFSNEHFEKYHWLIEELKSELELGLEHYSKHPEYAKSRSRSRKIKILLNKLETM